MNPTGVSLILHKILKLLDIQNLKTCRLVCKAWEYEVNKFIPIPVDTFTLSEESFQNVHTRPSHRCNHIIIKNNIPPGFVLEFVKHLLSSSHLQNSIRFLEIRSSSWTWAQLEDLYNSFEKLQVLVLNGNFILPRTDLTCRNYNQEHLSKKKQKPVLLKNLQTLYLNLKDEYLQNFVYTGLLQEISRKAPNLHEIKFCADLPCCTDASRKLTSYQTVISSQVLFLNVLHGASQLNLWGGLTSLCINFDMRNEDIRFLRDSNLPLQKLQFSVDKSLSPCLIDELLDSLRNTLVSLSIKYRSCNDSNNRYIPKLDSLCNLEYLSIHDETDERTICSGNNSNKSGEFLQEKTANEDETVSSTDIERMRRSSVEFIHKRLFPPSSVSHGSVFFNLTAIQLCSIYFNETDVLNFPRYFPNLVRIQISYLTDDELRVIIKNYPRLECLEAPDGLYTDAGLTGISPIIQDIFCNGVTNEIRKLDAMDTVLNIASLRYLRILKLSSKNVTDFGVINGIAYCKSVFVLTLDFPQITDVSIRKIAKIMPRLDNIHLQKGKFSVETLQQFQSNVSVKWTRN